MSAKSRPAGFYNIDPNPKGWPIIGKYIPRLRKTAIHDKNGKLIGPAWVLEARKK